MATKRERKHRHMEVSGHVTLDRRLPEWEAELVIAALDRQHGARPTPLEEVIDVAR